MLTLSNPPNVNQLMDADLNAEAFEELGEEEFGEQAQEAAPETEQAPSLTAKIEAILYLKAQPLSLATIADYASCDRAAAQEALTELLMDYAHGGSALEVVETETGYEPRLGIWYSGSCPSIWGLEPCALWQ
jgi:hypothetical protein